jgi:glycosyltransferase involved in cell wall biosynthesis
MPEVSGGAAHIANPFNPEEITQGLIEILNNEAYRKSLCDKGTERSKQFSWKNMAADYLRHYKLIYSEHSKH